MYEEQPIMPNSDLQDGNYYRNVDEARKEFCRDASLEVARHQQPATCAASDPVRTLDDLHLFQL
ncbi:uncharacterized protein CLAFUR5_14647 [Fulvia fulva]|uniref:Uncharacterized protein n=1 Tax=Passalora fulva TaxID=5499 RepID=A0A9Q8PN60_PASFU|nr:uncharacterized protein CLAFUR5_14647 [Fulvia fulva]KAK4608878.1 hypothetical protein CLAFUR0_14857 [Fulvia fulva]UJO25429.1 hypothetical protein CLAFUR5_14647 [Fulvia fulva]